MMETITQRNIQLGQDINNAWNVFCTAYKKGDIEEKNFEINFEIAFQAVRVLSERKRVEERAKWEDLKKP